MLRWIGFCFKIAFFSILVLVLGNTLHWDGRTISDQVRLKMSHAEYAPLLGTVRGWAEKVTQEAKKGIQKRPGHSISSEHAAMDEDMPSSERQKLKALIQELNQSRREN